MNYRYHHIKRFHESSKWAELKPIFKMVLVETPVDWASFSNSVKHPSQRLSQIKANITLKGRIHSHLHDLKLNSNGNRNKSPLLFYAVFHFSSAHSTGRQQSQFILLFAVPQLSCVYLMSHFLLVTCLCHLQNSHTGAQWLGGDFELFFPLAESFEITGRKFYKPVLLLLWITEKRFHLSDVDIITVAVCLQKATFYCAKRGRHCRNCWGWHSGCPPLCSEV